jgi:hypothetical protein
MTPSWIFDLLALVMLAVAAVSAARLLVARPWTGNSVIDDGDVAHLLMAIAMAGMLVPRLRTFPDMVWEVVFGGLIAWFAFRVVRDAWANGIRALAGGHCSPHLVHSGSMLYMFLATTSTAAMAGMAGMNELPGSSGSTMLTLNHPTLAFVFALILIGSSVWELDQLSGSRHRLAGARMTLAWIGAAGIPAMAGAESVTVAFSSPQAAGAAADTGQGSGAADGQAVPSGGGGGDAGVVGDFLLSPAVTIGCRVVMGVVMSFLLLIAI